MPQKQLPFTKINYVFLISGVVLNLFGFYTMTLDKESYGFGFLGITLGPILVVLGFVVQFFTIMYTPKKNPKIDKEK